MHAALTAGALLFADSLSVALRTESPTPSPTPAVDPNLVTPGPWGFVVIALLAVAVVALIADMMRRIRRGRVRADINDELDAEEQAAAAMRATETDGQSIDPDPQAGDSSRRPPG